MRHPQNIMPPTTPGKVVWRSLKVLLKAISFLDPTTLTFELFTF